MELELRELFEPKCDILHVEPRDVIDVMRFPPAYPLSYILSSNNRRNPSTHKNTSNVYKTRYRGTRFEFEKRICPAVVFMSSQTIHQTKMMVDLRSMKFLPLASA